MLRRQLDFKRGNEESQAFLGFSLDLTLRECWPRLGIASFGAFDGVDATVPVLLGLHVNCRGGGGEQLSETFTQTTFLE